MVCIMQVDSLTTNVEFVIKSIQADAYRNAKLLLDCTLSGKVWLKLKASLQLWPNTMHSMDSQQSNAHLNNHVLLPTYPKDTDQILNAVQILNNLGIGGCSWGYHHWPHLHWAEPRLALDVYAEGR